MKFSNSHFNDLKTYCITASFSKLHNRKGFSLIELMIVVGIMSVVALGITSLINDMTTAQSAIEEKLATLEASSGLTRAFANSAICGAQLGQPVTPSAVDLSPPSVATATITYPEIRMGASSIVKKDYPLPGYPVGRMMVQSIKLKNIALISGNNFSGDLEVVLNPTTTKRSLKPFGVKNLIFTASPAPFTSATITGCGSDSTPAGTPCGIQWHGGTWLTPLFECHGSVTPAGSRMACPPGYGGAVPGDGLITESARIQSGGGNSQWTCFKL